MLSKMEKNKRLYDKDGTELFTFRIDVCVTPKRIEYIAESEEEAKELFLENNPDLEEHDVEAIKLNITKEFSKGEKE